MKLGWKTIAGGIVAAFGFMSKPEVLSILPEKAAGVVTAIGTVLAVIGARHAIAKLQ